MLPSRLVFNVSEEQKYANMKLVSACKSGDISLARYLLEEGFAHIDCYNQGKTPLTAALEFKNSSLATLLINFPRVRMEQPDDLGQTPLHFACYHGLIELIRSLTPPLTSHSINRKDSYGRSPIMAAVELGKLEAVKEMIKVKGVDLRTINRDGECLIKVAGKNGFPEISRILYHEAGPERQSLRFSSPTLLVKARALGSIPTKVVITRSTMPPKHEDLNMLEDLELIQSEANESLDIKHTEQASEADNDIDVLRGIYANQIKETKTLRLTQRQERLVAISHMKECPICLEDLDPPKKIFQCVNGHLVCQPCQSRLPSCSLCKNSIIGRAIAMEQFLRVLHNI